MKTNTIHMGKKSKYDTHKINNVTIGDILNNMLSHYTPHEQSYWDTYGLGIEHLKEHVVSLQADAITEIDGKCFGIQRSTSVTRFENSVSDCELKFGTNGYCLAQEKIACSKKTHTGFVLKLSKFGGMINGKKTDRPYAEGDNDYYLVYLTQLDGKFQSAKTKEEAKRLKLVGLFLFPQSILIEKEVLSTPTQIGKTSMLVYLPDQYVERLGWKRQKRKAHHDWTKKYFHLVP